MNFHPPQFFTATILNWISLLTSDVYKKIIIDSLRFLTEKQKVKVYGFVIMPNHIHLIWQANETLNPSDVQRDFLKFTGQMMKFEMEKNDSNQLEKFHVRLKDRKYQFWQRNSLSIELRGREMIEQKLDYIHNNPVQGKWMLTDSPAGYRYSSYSFYELEKSDWLFLYHYMEMDE